MRWRTGLALLGAIGVSMSTAGLVPSATAAPGDSAAWYTRVHVGHPNSTVVISLTTDNYSGLNGWTAAYSCTAGYQGTSNVNNTGTPIASNLAIVPTDTNGDICIRAQRNTDIIVDLAGTLPNANITNPNRILDTRTQIIDATKMTSLEFANYLRSFAGTFDGTPIPPLLWSQPLADTARNHMNYLAYLRTVGSGYCNHREDPAFPAPTGQDRTHNVLSCWATEKEAISRWTNTPYHGPAFFNPAVRAMGMGSNSAGAAAGFDYSGSPRLATFPKPGGVMPNLRWQGAENPDPTFACPGDAPERDNGAPVLVFFPLETATTPFGALPTSSRTVTSWSIVDSENTPVPACWLVETSADMTTTTYQLPATSGGMVLFPKVPWREGYRYTVTITSQPAWGTTGPSGVVYVPFGSSTTWSFSFTAIPHVFLQ